MAETANLGLPLLAPSQAQKHVTVNEALLRLDALAKGVLVSRAVATPPATPAEGAVWAVPSGATGEWVRRDGELAIATGGGWSFVAPRKGWRAYALDEGAALRHDGSGWTVEGPVAVSPSGAATSVEIVEADHRVTSGATSDTVAIIPRASMVLGVTARVTEAITGTLTTWKLGNVDAGAENRFGSGLGKGVGSYAEGLLGAPMTFWTDASLRLTAEGGVFESGRVRLAVHCLRLTIPSR